MITNLSSGRVVVLYGSMCTSLLAAFVRRFVFLSTTPAAALIIFEYGKSAIRFVSGFAINRLLNCGIRGYIFIKPWWINVALSQLLIKSQCSFRILSCVVVLNTD